jgi:hypothetical protein
MKKKTLFEMTMTSVVIYIKKTLNLILMAKVSIGHFHLQIINLKMMVKELLQAT